MLLGSGEFGASNEKIALEVRKIDGRDYTDKDGKTTTYNESFDYEQDITDLVGQYVKVTTGKNDKVYGVFAVSSENTVVTAALSDIKLVSGTKVKVDGTEYKYDKDADIYGTDTDTAIAKISDIAGDSYNSADTITFISNDGDATFDVAYINQIKKVAKVTYVSDDSFTAGGTSYDFADVVAPEDLAKNDYVVISTDLFSGDDLFVKADKVSGKVTSTKGSSGAYTDIKLADSDEWFKVAAADVQSIKNVDLVDYDDDTTIERNSSYDLVLVNGVVYIADKTASGSSDTALVTGASNSMDTDGNRQVKLLFADGTEKVVPAKEYYDLKIDTGAAFVTYDTDDGAYTVETISKSNVVKNFGDDYTYDSKTDGNNNVFDKDTDRLAGKRVADDATIYVQYKDGNDTKNTVITGATLNDMGSNFGDKVYYVTDGTLVVAALIVGDTYLPGASADKLYGYVTSDVTENTEDDVDFKSFDVWTSEGESINVKMKASIDVAKGDLISFELTADNFIEGVKTESEGLTVETAAIKQVGSSYVMFYTDDASKSDYKLSDDVQYLYLNTKDVKGVNGGELVKADENTINAIQGKTKYYANAKYVLDGDEIVMIAIDVNMNKWDGEADIVVTK